MSDRGLSVESATDTLDLPAMAPPATISTHSLSVPQLATTTHSREGSHSSVTDGLNELNGSGSNTPNLGEGYVDDDSSMDEEEEVLEQQELAAFGLVGGEDDGLPPPPKPDGGKGEKKGPHNALSAAARAKRPSKNIKVSGGSKALSRRSLTGGAGKAEAASDLPNHDYCDACNGKGQFLCCDGGCLRSFHLTCLEPPLDIDQVPDESWYCKACKAEIDPPPRPDRGFFRELIAKVDRENPKAFELSPEIKALYKNVASGPNGEFIDTVEHRGPNKNGGRTTGEERDGYRTKDKNGKTILCYNCSEAASTNKARKIVSCDFCEQHWHLDCLNPPLVGMPPQGRKWQCPLHADQLLPKKRIPKAAVTIPVQERGVRNNGDVVVVPKREPPKQEEYDELTVNRIRYQVPEETLILDFWARVQPQQHVGRTLGPADGVYGHEYEVEEVGSPLTSLGEMSDADPPEVAKLGYSPYRKPSSMNLHPHPRPSKVAKIYAVAPEPTELDRLAALAEGFYALEHSATAMDVDSTPAPAPAPAPAKGKSRASATLTPGPAAGKNGELLVASQEDLKALTHIRKMLRQDAWKDPRQKATLLGYFEGDMIVPQVASLKGKQSQPWDLPWEDKDAAQAAK